MDSTYLVYAMILSDDMIKHIYLPLFYKEGEAAIKIICSCKVPMDVFLLAYKRIAPIPQDEVEELFAYATELFPNETELFRMNVAKVTYTLAQYLN